MYYLITAVHLWDRSENILWVSRTNVLRALKGSRTKSYLAFECPPVYCLRRRERSQPRTLSLPCHPQTFQQQVSGVIYIITKLVTEGYQIIEKLWEVDKCNLAESEVYLNACCRVSIGLHGLLQEALVHNAVTKVVAWEHLHGAKENYQRKLLTWIMYISSSYLCAWVGAGWLRRRLSYFGGKWTLSSILCKMK